MKIRGQGVGCTEVWDVAFKKKRLALDSDARGRMQKSRDYIVQRVDDGEVIYGVNTGFGAFSDVKISPPQVEELQVNLIRSHCVGVGSPFGQEETRAILLLRANALATGLSGIRPEVVDQLLLLLNEDVIPVVPQQGSVGASGDLAPLSHVALVLMGEGDVWHEGSHVPAAERLQAKEITPLRLKAKEGLALINGCQVMTAVGLLNGLKARRLIWMCDLAGAMSLEALKGSRRAFDPLITAVRPHAGEIKTANNLRRLLGEKSPISESHAGCSKVQDAYSLRCMPAVHGAAKDAIRRGIDTLEIEANSSTDNPLVFAEENKILSCGNFHGEPVALVLDYMGIAIAAMASISECRIAKLINPAMSGLPAFLAPQGGLNSGHMIVQVAAASLVSENKILSHPASVDSIPTSADKEDHVSMGTIAARKLGQIVGNAENIVAMEILSACQALDLLKPLAPDGVIKAVYDVVREHVPFAEKDRVFSGDVAIIRRLISDETILSVVEKHLGELEW